MPLTDSIRGRMAALKLRAKYPLEGTAVKRNEAKAVEDRGFKVWLDTIFPDQFDTAFIEVHTDFWEWGWKFLICLRDRKPLPPEANAFLALWSRNYGKSLHSEVFSAAAICVVGYGIFLYISGTQDLANEHLDNIEGLLTSEGVKDYYPEHSRPKRSAITGANKAWSQKKLATEGGAVMWAIGLNVGVRGIRKGKDRVRGFILDDIDDYNDSPQIALNKANTLGSSVLPTSDVDYFVIGVQNLITEHSVFNRIYTQADMMLAHRVVSGPFPAYENLVTEFRDGRDMIVSGESNWPERVTDEVGQRFIDTYGLIRFLAEFQHDFTTSKQGLCFGNYDDDVHVITQSEFNKMFACDGVPRRWWKYQFHDHARTKTAYHANVTGTVAVSSKNEKLPGFIFLYNLMSFPAQTEADDLAVRFLKSLAPEVVVHGRAHKWDELVKTSLDRAGVEAYVSDTTKLLQMRRSTLARIIPPLVGPLLQARNFKAFRMSHEANKGPGKVYRDAYGIPFQPCNPGADGGIELFNHYLKVDYGSAHPFGANKNRPDGRGFTRVFIIVADRELAYTHDVASERLHDEMLCRFQFKHWRYTTPKLNARGEKEYGPMKMHDDFGNGLMMLFHDNSPQAAPLTAGETINEYVPEALSDNTIQMELDPQRRANLLMAQAIKKQMLTRNFSKPKTRNAISRLRHFARN